jgi:hypothetical protein
MRGRGIKVEVMFLNPRFPLQAIIRRQILEGVHGVTKLDMRCQQSAKIPLQVFDRQGGANNVRFDEYQDLDPKIAAELILRPSKHKHKHKHKHLPKSKCFNTHNLNLLQAKHTNHLLPHRLPQT